MYDSLSSHQQIKVIFKHEVRSVSILMGYQEPRFLPLLGLVRKVSVSLILIFCLDLCGFLTFTCWDDP